MPYIHNKSHYLVSLQGRKAVFPEGKGVDCDLTQLLFGKQQCEDRRFGGKTRALSYVFPQESQQEEPRSRLGSQDTHVAAVFRGNIVLLQQKLKLIIMCADRMLWTIEKRCARVLLLILWDFKWVLVLRICKLMLSYRKSGSLRGLSGHLCLVTTQGREEQEQKSTLCIVSS